MRTAYTTRASQIYIGTVISIICSLETFFTNSSANLASQVEPRTSALNITLPAAAARALAAIERQPVSNVGSCRSLPAACAQAADVDRRDRQTDRRTDTRPLHRPCNAKFAGSVNKAERRRPTVISVMVRQNKRSSI